MLFSLFTAVFSSIKWPLLSINLISIILSKNCQFYIDNIEQKGIVMNRLQYPGLDVRNLEENKILFKFNQADTQEDGLKLDIMF